MRDVRLWLALFLPGLAVTAGMCFVHWSQPGWLTFLDYKVYDVLLRQRPKPPLSGRVVVVDVDEKTLAEVGQWPWPRYQTALLLGRLKQYGAAAVGMDMVFSEPDQTSPERIRRQLGALGVEMDFTGLPEGLRDNDRLLAENLAGGPFVLGYFFTFTREQNAAARDDCALPPPRLTVRRAPGATDMPLQLSQAEAAVCPLPELTRSGRWAGFFNSFPDQDNIVRWVPLAIAYKGSPYPSLAVATLMRAFGDKGGVLFAEPNPYGGQDISLRLDLGELGMHSIPLDRQGRVLLDYRGPSRTFPYISASDVMQGRVPAEELAGKIVFVGTSARGLQDVRATPLDQSCPGVEAHATVAEMVLTDRYLRHPIDGWYMELLLTGLFGLCVTVQMMFTRSLWVGVSALLAGAGMWGVSVWSMNAMDFHLSPLAPLMVLAVDFTLLTFLKFLLEERQKRFIQSAFGHYLSPAVVDQIVDQPDRLTLTGEEKQVSILFSDVRGFTTISEKLSPTQVVALLHEYLTPMTRLITEHSGTLDKFIGDAVMAFWNAPLDVPGHPRQAMLTALAMLRELDELNKGFKARYGFGIDIGVGVHCGSVRVGNFGSEDLFDYTIIGDNVNLCSRLEGLTKYYHQRLLATQAMRDGAGEGFTWQEVDRVLVKGKHEPVTIYTLRTDAPEGELERWESGLALYRAGSFGEALLAFEALDKDFDGELYALFAGRCRQLLATPPGPDWAGVFEHTTK